MIVADANLIVHLALGGADAADARRARSRDADWVAPLLWRSEVRNVCVTLLRARRLGIADAYRAMELAEWLVRGRGYHVESTAVLRLAADSGCSAYDAEYVALAQDLDVPLVTADRALVRRFTAVAIPLSAFARGG